MNVRNVTDSPTRYKLAAIAMSIHKCERKAMSYRFYVFMYSATFQCRADRL